MKAIIYIFYDSRILYFNILINEKMSKNHKLKRSKLSVSFTQQYILSYFFIRRISLEFLDFIFTGWNWIWGIKKHTSHQKCHDKLVLRERKEFVTSACIFVIIYAATCILLEKNTK